MTALSTTSVVIRGSVIAGAVFLVLLVWVLSGAVLAQAAPELERTLESSLLQEDPLTGLESESPVGGMPPSTAGGTPTATEGGFVGGVLRPVLATNAWGLRVRAVRVEHDGGFRDLPVDDRHFPKRIEWGRASVPLFHPVGSTEGLKNRAGGRTHPVNPVGAEFLMERWTVKDGLPHEKVRALHQTRDGALWVGTAGGVARLRGGRFEVFAETNTPAMKEVSQVVRSMTEDEQGDLWLGTVDGLMRYRGGEFEVMFQGAGLTYVNALIPATGGGVWVGADRGVARCDAQGIAWHILPGISRVCAIQEGADGILWVGGHGGLVGWQVQERRVVHRHLDAFSESEGEAVSIPVRGLLLDRDGCLWIGSGWYLWRLAAGDTQAVVQRGPGIVGPWPLLSARLAEDAHGSIWAADGNVGGGVHLFMRGAEGYTPVRLPFAFESPQEVEVDRDGCVWVGDRQGLYRISRRGFQGLAMTELQKDLSPFHSIVEAPGGAIWFSGDRFFSRWGGSDFWHVDLRSHIPLCRPVFLTGRDHRVTVLGASASSATLDVDAVDPAGIGRVVAGLRSVGEPTAVSRMDDERWYLGSKQGLFLSDGTRGLEKVAAIGERTVQAMGHDEPGGVWVALDGYGLGRWSGQELEKIIDEAEVGRIKALCVGRDGRVWVGSERCFGVVVDGRFRRLILEFEGAFPRMSAVLEDAVGDIWLNISSGLARIQRQHLEQSLRQEALPVVVTEYGVADGVIHTEIVSGAQTALTASDGRLWFVKRSGLVVVDLDHLPRDSGAPQPRLDSVEVEGSGVRPQTPMDTPIRGRGGMTFRFSSGDAPAPKGLKTQYRLAGMDPAWRDAGAASEAMYVSLPPGRYQFQLRSRMRDSAWSDPRGATWAVEVTRPFWKSWVFASAIGLLAMTGGVGWLGRRRAVDRVRSARDQRDSVERERRRIARELHDHLGPRIATLSMPGQGVVDAHDRARETLRELNEMIWSVNPSHDRLPSLADFVSDFAGRYLGAAGLKLELDVALGLPDLEVAAVPRRELAAMFKEALRNAVQHAGASMVGVVLTCVTGDLVLSVRDDGRGLPAGSGERAAVAGRPVGGLAQFEDRMRVLGGTCVIASASGRGTRIEFRLPLSRLCAEPG